eukprot:3798565-Amphidinium_carterae.1
MSSDLVCQKTNSLFHLPLHQHPKCYQEQKTCGNGKPPSTPHPKTDSGVCWGHRFGCCFGIGIGVAVWFPSLEALAGYLIVWLVCVMSAIVGFVPARYPTPNLCKQ